MALLRALLVDRDSIVLARVCAELEQLGYAVETLGSTIGLTPELITLSVPSLVLFDAELPGLEPKALMVLVRSLQSTRAARVVVSTSGPIDPLKKMFGNDAVAKLLNLDMKDKQDAATGKEGKKAPEESKAAAGKDAAAAKGF